MPFVSYLTFDFCYYGQGNKYHSIDCTYFPSVHLLSCLRAGVGERMRCSSWLGRNWLALCSAKLHAGNISEDFLQIVMGAYFVEV